MPDIPLHDDPLHDDSPPAPPMPPGDDDCCRSGCDPCVWDLYAEEMEGYREALRVWEERQEERKAKEAGTG